MARAKTPEELEEERRLRAAQRNANSAASSQTSASQDQQSAAERAAAQEAARQRAAAAAATSAATNPGDSKTQSSRYRQDPDNPYSTNPYSEEEQNADEREGDALGLDSEEVRRRRQENAVAGEQGAAYKAASYRAGAAGRQRVGTIEDERRRALGLSAYQTEAARQGSIERVGSNVGQIDRSNIRDAEQFRNTQAGLISRLEAAERGEGPSLAQSQLRQATDRNLSQLMGMQAAVRGRATGALQQRQLMGAQSAAQQDAAIQSADLRMREQLAAREQLAGVAGQARGQDIGLRGQDIGLESTQAGMNLQREQFNTAAENARRAANTGYEQQANLANLASQNSTQALREQLAQQYMAQGMTQEEANRRAETEALNVALKQQEDANKRAHERYLTEEAQPGLGDQILGVASQAIGGAAMGAGAALASDVNAKTNIQPAGAIQPMGSNVPDLGVMEAKLKPMSEDDEAESFLSKFGKSLYKSDMGSTLGNGFKQMAYGLTNKLMGGSAPTPDVSSDMMGKTNVVSDKNKKMNAETKPKSESDEFLQSLKAYTWDYKNPMKHGSGRHLGVMAQDLEKTPYGRSMVFDTPDGKKVDAGKLANAAMASILSLDERLKAIESKKGK